MRILMVLLLLGVPRLSLAYTMESVLRPWLKARTADLGLLRGATAAAKAVSVFTPATLAKGLASPSELRAAGAPLSFTGATPAGYQLRRGAIFPYGPAYLLHYQEGEPESDDHLFRLCRRGEGKALSTVWELGTCIGELRQIRLSPNGPEFILLVESNCGGGYTMRLVRTDAPMEEPLSLHTWQGDLRIADLDGDGYSDLVHSSRKEPPAPIGLRLMAASDYAPPQVLWLSTVWRWDGQRWGRAGDQWSRRAP